MFFFKKKNSYLEYGRLVKNILYIGDYAFRIIQISVPKGLEFTINSKFVYQIGKKLFRIPSDIPNILIIKGNVLLKRYLNENEIRFIKPLEFFWNMYVIKESETKELMIYLKKSYENSEVIC